MPNTKTIQGDALSTRAELVEVPKGYKKTKIGWIPDDWEVLRVGEICDCIVPGRNKPKIFDGDIPWITMPNLSNYGLLKDSNYHLSLNEIKNSGAKIVPKGSVIFSCVGELGIVAMAGRPIVINQQLHAFIPQKELNNYFLMFSLSMQMKYIESIATKTAVPYLNKDNCNSIPIPLPPLPEQQKIAKILSAWDKAIEQTQNLIEQLKYRKKGLMQQLLTGKTRLKGFSGNWKKYQLGDLANNYNLINKDNKVQEVLSCTKYDGLVRSLEYFGRKVYGDDLSKYKVVPSGYFAYATNHIEEGSIGYQDVLDFGLVSPMYTVFKTNDKVDDSFFYKLLKTDKLIYYYQSNMSGTIARRGGLRWNVFETIVVKIPSIEEQQAIAKVLTTADKEIKTQENYLAQLQDQKKGLMQQLLTGQKRVKV